MVSAGREVANVERSILIGYRVTDSPGRAAEVRGCGPQSNGHAVQDFAFLVMQRTGNIAGFVREHEVKLTALSQVERRAQRIEVAEARRFDVNPVRQKRDIEVVARGRDIYDHAESPVVLE